MSRCNGGKGQLDSMFTDLHSCEKLLPYDLDKGKVSHETPGDKVHWFIVTSQHLVTSVLVWQSNLLWLKRDPTRSLVTKEFDHCSTSQLKFQRFTVCFYRVLWTVFGVKTCEKLVTLKNHKFHPLRFLVVSLSTCTVIADLSGETCATWRSSMRQHEHNGLGVPGAAFPMMEGRGIALILIQWSHSGAIPEHWPACHVAGATFMIAPDERDTRYKEEMARFSMMTKNSVRLLYDLIMWITLITLFIVIMSQQLGTTGIWHEPQLCILPPPLYLNTWQAVSDVLRHFQTFSTLTHLIFRIRGICRIRQHLVSGRNQQK